MLTSGTEGYQKRTGRLFDVLLRRWEGANGICHVGDDSRADGRMPSSRGIRSVVVYDRRNMLHRHRVQGMRTRREREAYLASLHDWVPPSPAHDVGYQRFGPVYTGFAQAIAARAAADGVHSVWFMAREGWLLHELYEMVRRRSSLPPSGYLYISRVAAMRAQLSEFGEREMASVHSDTWSRSFRSTLSPLQLSVDELHALLSPAGISPEDSVTPERFAKLAASKSFQTVVERIGEEERQGLKAYLARTGFPMSGRVAIVDVGWGGQIQENFSRALRKMGVETEVVGYYLGTDDRAEQRRQDGLQLHGLLVDRAKNDGRGLGAFSFVQGIEIATRSPHGSVRGYNLDGTPRLAADAESGRRAERDDDPLIARMQEGVLSYASRYLDISRITGASTGSGLELATDVLDVLATCPARDEARLLSRMKNVANLGMDETLGLTAEVSLRHPLTALRVLRNTLWKEGTGAIIFPIAGPPSIMLYRRINGLLPLRHGKLGEREAGQISSSSRCGETDGDVSIVADVLDLGLGELRGSLAVCADDAGATRLRCSFAIDLLKLAVVRLLHGAGVRPVLALAKDTAASDFRYLLKQASAALPLFRR